MSKHSKKHSRQQEYNDGNNFDMNNMGNLFNNINPNQLSGLLNNIDLSQLSSMFQGTSENHSPNVQSGGGDRRLELLNALKPMVDADKSRMIDSIIQIYNISKIMRR